MDLGEYLLDTFRFNDKSNKQVLEKIQLLPDPSEPVKFFSHLINCQYKWMARIVGDPNVSEMDWWNPLYKLEELHEKWEDSLNIWLQYIRLKTEAELNTEVIFIGYDGSNFAATPKDIALQLNYHSIHHRAQIQTIIRQQGLEPDFVDYIGQKYRRV
jgi:uncharacterized damage-inducible protein DinB